MRLCVIKYSEYTAALIDIVERIAYYYKVTRNQDTICEVVDNTHPIWESSKRTFTYFELNPVDST